MRKSVLAAVTALVAALLAIAVAIPASAVTIKTGFGRIDGIGLDLGTNFNATTGEAGGDATFTWDLTGGVTTLNVNGSVGAFGRPGVAVRLEVRYFDGQNGTGSRVGPVHVGNGFTPATDLLTLKNVNWSPTGDVGVLSAKVSVASDPDGDGVYTVEKSIISTL
jgi:hypothetical protein